MFLDLKLRSKDTITFTVFYMASTGPVKTRLWMTQLMARIAKVEKKFKDIER